ncbi:ArsR/SmtB family transcription factor [Spirosoma sp.]|uniref:ArsR/SmtB family transcription factor n=1 Tax=Spirosoma sp. TaxID=1899569 RepID=UPI003B3B3E06
MSEQKVDQAAEILKLIAHPIRIRIILALAGQSTMNVTALQQHLQVDTSLLSHYLTKMKDHKLLQSVRQGKEMYYSLANDDLTKAVMLLLDRERE